VSVVVATNETLRQAVPSGLVVGRITHVLLTCLVYILALLHLDLYEVKWILAHLIKAA
jgi:hypothetical protein